MEVEAPSRKIGRGPRRSSSFYEVVEAFPGISQTTFKYPGEEEEEENPGKRKSLMINQIMAKFQGASCSKYPKAKDFKTPSVKAPEFLDGIEPFKVRSFIQSCQLIFHNDQAYFCKDMKEVLYATSFLIGRASK
ncbi:hypothetical protein O181_023669 [Austropuccinia psidii MF-1]|uniref:Uncharacterized protein n=1 Tax=Austropuccinia psidii MF-1 TaxID=1389203 RepID=A0A9Q3GYW5_9BASI|nr:hypothetical protein [Austropuccinia psidii MF-1]